MGPHSGRRGAYRFYHGLVGLKSHCKLCLLVRHDPDGVTRRYAHIGTGELQSHDLTVLYRRELADRCARDHIPLCIRCSTISLHILRRRAMSRWPSRPLILPPTLWNKSKKETEHARNGRPSEDRR